MSHSLGGKPLSNASSLDCELVGARRKIEKRKFVQHDYHDHANDREQDYRDRYDDEYRAQRAKGGVTETFPLKLHYMLETIDHKTFGHIVSWQPHGRAFKVKRPYEFVAKVMPKYFHQSKITSFQRQLNLYGFHRLSKGPDSGAYYHELFLRGRPFLCNKMTRTKVKGSGHRKASSPETEPNFYEMEFVYENITHNCKQGYQRICTSFKSPGPTQPSYNTNAVRQHLTSKCAIRDSRQNSPFQNLPWKPALPEYVLISPETRTKGRVTDFLPLKANDDLQAQIRNQHLTFPRHNHVYSVEMHDTLSVSSAGIMSLGVEEDEIDVVSFEGKRFHYLDTDDLYPRVSTLRHSISVINPTAGAESKGGCDARIIRNESDASVDSTIYKSDEMSNPDFSLMPGMY